MFQVQILADSVNPVGNRLTSFLLTYPRFIHQELLTHRQLSRNAMSSRAIPVEKMIRLVEEGPAEPVFWGKNQKGMQAAEELAEPERAWARNEWLDAMRDAVKHARRLIELGVHKQIANRVLEPFTHMTTIMSATEWANFFNLRCHPGAQPEFQELAYQMLEAYVASTPRKLAAGQWHLPFADRFMDEDLTVAQRLKITTARCARVSYLSYDGQIEHAKDYELHDQLRDSGHWSPFEHAAQAWSRSHVFGNFRGWMQYRKVFANECRSALDPQALLAKRRSRS